MKITVEAEPDELIRLMEPHEQESDDEQSQPYGKVLMDIHQKLGQCIQSLSHDFFENL